MKPHLKFIAGSWYVFQHRFSYRPVVTGNSIKGALDRYFFYQGCGAFTGGWEDR